MFDLPQRDRALARAIVATSLRRRGEIDRVLDTFLERGMPDKGGKLYPILLSGAAQLLFLKTPPHAAIDLAVRLAQWDSRARRYDKLVNAVLRRVAKEGEAIASSLDAPRVNTPDWLWDAVGRALRRGSRACHRRCQSHRAAARSDGEERSATLGNRDVGPRASQWKRAPSAQGPHRSAPGFEQGAWWVQDVAASLPAHLMGDVAGKRVADLCAAPGGKTAQLALAGASVVAVDISKTRLKMLAANLARLGLAATAVAADAATWAPDERFDAVLLDAPCSSTGTIRRHPDIPYLKSPKDIEALAPLQARLLDNAAALLKPGGTLVYSTCSLEIEEGEAQIAALLARNPDDSGRPDPAGRRVWAGRLATVPGVPQDFSLPARPRDAGMERHGRVLCRAPETQQIAASGQA